MTTRYFSKFLITISVVVLAVMFILWFPLYANADEGFSLGEHVRVNVGDFLNLRAEPQGKIIGQIRANEIVEIIGKRDRDGYYKIRIVRTQEEGYAYGEYLAAIPNWSGNTWNNTPTPSPKPTATPVPTPTATPTYTVSTMAGLEIGSVLVVNSSSKLNFRIGPGYDYPRLIHLSNEDKLVALSNLVINDFIFVLQESTGYTGYVHKKFIVVTNDTVTSYDGPCTCPHCILNKCCECQQW